MTGEHIVHATREWVVERSHERATPTFRVVTDYELARRNLKLRETKHTLRTARLRVDHCARHEECVDIPEIGRSCAALETVVYEVHVWFAPGSFESPRRINVLAGRLLHTLHIFGELVTDESGRAPPPAPFEDVTGKGAAMLDEHAPRFGDEGYGRCKATVKEDGTPSVYVDGRRDG